MRIEELSPGLSLTFLVTVNTEPLSFQSKVQEVHPKKHIVLADAILHNDKIVSFRGKNVIVHVLVTFPDEKPQLFQHVKVTTLKREDGSFCYNLSTVAESKPYNRREYFRCFIGVPAVTQFGPNHSARDAVLRDVSVSGFAVTCSEDMEVSINQLIHVHLQDYIDELEEEFTFNLYGLIVRTQELENGKFIYGCRLNRPVFGLNNYIMKKERIRLRNCNGGNL